MTSKFSHPFPRPDFTIEVGPGSKLGNCYYAHGYTITSLHRLSQETIEGLRDLGLLGYGQGFDIHSQCDGTEAPGLVLESPCVEYDERGEAQPGPAINPYSGKPYGPTTYSYYVYKIERRVDSGD